MNAGDTKLQKQPSVIKEQKIVVLIRSGLLFYSPTTFVYLELSAVSSLVKRQTLFSYMEALWNANFVTYSSVNE